MTRDQEDAEFFRLLREATPPKTFQEMLETLRNTQLQPDRVLMNASDWAWMLESNLLMAKA